MRHIAYCGTCSMLCFDDTTFFFFFFFFPFLFFFFLRPWRQSITYLVDRFPFQREIAVDTLMLGFIVRSKNIRVTWNGEALKKRRIGRELYVRIWTVPHTFNETRAFLFSLRISQNCPVTPRCLLKTERLRKSWLGILCMCQNHEE